MYIYQVKLPQPLNITSETILDGKLVKEKKRGGLVFMVFDAIVIKNESFFEDKKKKMENEELKEKKEENLFSKRFEKVINFIKEIPPKSFPFDIRATEYYKLREIEHAINQIAPSLKYNTDGIVF